MRLTESLPFAAEWLAGEPPASGLRPGATPEPGEVVLDGTWRLHSEDARLARAATYLAAVLEHGFGIRLGSAGGQTISLATDSDCSDEEAHRLIVAPSLVELRGGGPAGVLQAVFELERRLRERGGPFLAPGEQARRPLFRWRIHRSPLSPFYVDELTGLGGPPLDPGWISPLLDYPAFVESDSGPDTYYHDGLLMALARDGFNAVWLRGSLRLFARCAAFPEFGAHAEAWAERLNVLCERAAGWGLRAFVHLNEPMGFAEDDPFWARHQELRGGLCPLAPMRYFCTSQPQVLDYLQQASADLFGRVPALAGAVLISNSEFPTHCYAHTARPVEPQARAQAVLAGRLCPRCAEREPGEVIAQVVNTLRDGIKAAQPAAEVIAWNWSWSSHEPDPQRGVLERLAGDIVVMADYERGTATSADGVPYLNDEYNLKVIGPSERYVGVADYLRQRSRSVYARIQIGTTHENPSLPYLPVLPNIARKYRSLPVAGASGLMTCWNFGNMPSLATEVAGEFSFDPQPSEEEGLLRVARRCFGPEVAKEVVAAWHQASDAHDHFPGSIPVMYNGPVSRGPAFRFALWPVERDFPNSWLLERETLGDRLNWCQPFEPQHVLACFRAEARDLEAPVAALRALLPRTAGADRQRLQREANVLDYHRRAVLSGAHVLDFLLARDSVGSQATPAERAAAAGRMRAAVEAELANAEAAVPLLEADPRLGWHGEAYGYLSSPALVRAKCAELREMCDVGLARWIAEAT